MDIEGKEKVIKALDHAIKTIENFKNNIGDKNTDFITVRIKEDRDLKPYYKLGAPIPSGLKQEGAYTISIEISDETNIGKIFK